MATKVHILVSYSFSFRNKTRIGYPVVKNNEVIRLEGTFQDILDTVYNQELLSAAKDKAENVLREKSTFLANMSHEIRTPLNGIIGFTSLLLEQKLPEETLEQVKLIQNFGDSLSVLINDTGIGIPTKALKNAIRIFSTSRLFDLS